tara:strand:+ start:960 stop:1622 length:663 start_codon:yes stop_codon:yes gene_type:complete
MNINRKRAPGMRIRKFHNGGKGPGHPHGDLTTAKLDSILSSSVDGAIFEFSQFRDLVGSHEGASGGYSARQIGGGPGRGMYQFDEASAQTAYNRLKTIASDRGYSIPKLTNEDFKNMDKVSPEIQDLLFTANIAKSPNTSISTILTDKSQWDNQWLDGHWRGKDKDREVRRASFQHTQDNFPVETTEKNPSINSAFWNMFPDENTVTPDKNNFQYIQAEF